MTTVEQHNEPFKRQVQLTCYRFSENDSTVKAGVLFNYEEYTPKKTDEKKYNDSPMEVEYFENNSNIAEDADKMMKKNIEENGISRDKKTRPRKLVCNIDFEKKKTDASLRKKVGIVCATIIISLVLHFLFLEDVPSETCNCEVSIIQLRQNLLSEVYNQTNCTDSIISSLYSKSEWPKKKKILVYTGGIGVGKTLTIDIIKRHFPKQGVLEIVHFDQKADKFYSNICCNLVVIDNLNVVHTKDVIELLKTLPDNRYTLVITVFNVQKTDSDLNYHFDYEAVDTIHREFTASSLYFESCKFNTLDESTALIWLKREFAKRGIDESIQKNITDYVLANSNFTQTGFKRLGQKLSLATEVCKIH